MILFFRDLNGLTNQTAEQKDGKKTHMHQIIPIHQMVQEYLAPQAWQVLNQEDIGLHFFL